MRKIWAILISLLLIIQSSGFVFADDLGTEQELSPDTEVTQEVNDVSDDIDVIDTDDTDTVIQDSGTCGKELTWTLTPDMTLIISGTGSMFGYPQGKERPWINYASSVKSIVVEDGVTSIGESAFSDFILLTSVDMPNSVVGISTSAFSGCSRLENITMGGVQSIGESAFADCSSLENITLPDCLRNISEYAFSCCSNLKDFTFPDSLETIGKYAFSDCSKLKNIVIPNKVMVIRGGSFLNCISLETVTIPRSIVGIFMDPDPFEGCYNVLFLVERTSCGWWYASQNHYNFEFFCNHSVVIDEAVKPTCDSVGYTEGSHCSICGEVFKAQEVIPAIGPTL
ncbi:MAG: leucine-rich repeat domain-containing protein, partial [Mogibacterium sp.]|nr:leucine-rich repeat domain-containing protein [Mogibacterium sp.]